MDSLRRLIRRVPILAYHAIAQQNLNRLPTGWSRSHIVNYCSFWAQLHFLKDNGWETVGIDALSQSCDNDERKRIVITFDDGHASDTIAAEALQRHGFSGVFFVPWSQIGQTGYLAPSSVQELAKNGFKIGSHGLHHAPLAGRHEAELRRELVESKSRLEDLTATEINDLAVPFGRYDRHVIGSALSAGYKRIATSDMGIARVRASILPRLPVTAQTTMDDFCTMLSSGPLEVMWRRICGGARRRLFRTGQASPAQSL